MSYEDFCHYFTNLDICHMFNMSIFSFRKTWKESKIKGHWRQPDRCGGCGNHSSFLNNPQVFKFYNGNILTIKMSTENIPSIL